MVRAAMQNLPNEMPPDASASPGNGLPGETRAQLDQVFQWFNDNVAKLEGAYKDLGVKFDKISQELEEKNQKLEASFSETDRVENQLRSVLESLDSSVVMIDTEERITLFNRSAERIYAMKPEDALGKSYAEVFRTQADAHFPLIETLRHQRNLLGHEKYWKIGGGGKPIGYTTSVVKNRDGKVLGAVEISTDLTNIKQMQNQMQHAKTLAALGEMAATVAHEIRNPLAGIGGFAGLLERDLEGDDPRRALVKKIVQGVSSLNKIVSNLLVYTRHMELNLQRVDFIEWMEEILNYAEIEIAKENKDIAIARDYRFERMEARIDPEKFQQVFLNLIFNAIQSIEGKGRITIRADLDEKDFLRIAIIDDGKGIPKDIMDKIFNPFFTTKEQGTGLGLAIVQRIVTLHGGTITVTSEPGRFTRFEIRIDTRGSVHG
ncbi:MAG: atoS 1 [Fibrobacteres bacterium]|nr:atoS 1 [Fibrobacterota bacterium]